MDFHSCTVSERLTIARIIKVNHAGEYGAIRIYRAQLSVAKRLVPGLVDFLEETLGHEIQHCELFADAMQTRNTRPCRAMWLWSFGGYLLGLFTALTGAKGIWLCTAAVEHAVHQHLEDQLRFLEGKDSELQALIQSIQIEELHHLKTAECNLNENSGATKVSKKAIMFLTDLLIWLSTWGDSSKLKKSLK